MFVIVSFNSFFYRGLLIFLPDLIGDLLRAAIGDVQPGFFDFESALSKEFDLAQYLYAGLLTFGIGGQYSVGGLIGPIQSDRDLIVMLTPPSIIALILVLAVRAGLLSLLAVSFVLSSPYSQCNRLS